MGFLPSGWPYNQTPLGGQMYQTQGQPTPSDPNAYLAQLMAVYNSPIGQSAQAAQQQTIAMNVKQALAAMANERDRIAIDKGKAEADRWFKEESLKLAQQAHALAVQTQQQNYGLAVGGLTGTFNGQPTLAGLGQQAMYTGLYNGQPTLQAQNQQQQYALQQAQLALSQLTQQQQHELAQGTLNLATLTQQQRNAIEQAQLGLTQAGVTGEFNGRPTLAALAQQQNFGLTQAGVTGSYNGAPTLAAQGQMFDQGLAMGAQTGYQNGAPTLAREQAAANTALQAGQLGASLRGPGDWAQFLQAQNAVAGSPASALVASAPGGLGMATGDGGGPMTLSRLLTGFGVMPGQGPGQPGFPNVDPATGGSTMPGMSMGGGPIDQTGAPLPSGGSGGLPWMGGGSGGYSEPWTPPGAPVRQDEGGGMAPPDTNSPQYRDIQARLGAGTITAQQAADEWARLTAGGAPAAPGGFREPGQRLWAGGSPTFNESTGSYSSAPAGGMRRTMPSSMPMGGFPNVDPATGGSTLTGMAMTNAGGGGMQTQQQQQWAASADPWTQQQPWFQEQNRNNPYLQQSPMQQQGWNPYSMTGALGQAAAAPRVTNAQLGLSDQEAGTLQNYFKNPNQAPSTWWTSKSKDQKAYLGGLNQYWGGSNDTFLERERNARPRQQAWNAAV